MKTLLENLVNKLIATSITRGVQPSDLADAIFEDPYTHMDIKKNSSNIIVVLTYVDCGELGDLKTTHRMRYTYNSDRYLILIEQSINKSKYGINWDRKATIDSLFNEINSLVNTQEDKNYLLSKLPCELINTSRTKLRLVS